MKKLFLILCVFSSFILNSQTNKSATALLIIDVQDFYFPGGKAELVKPELASQNVKLLLGNFRKKNQSVIHVRHNFEPGGKIHKDVIPLENEKLISKDEVNCFKGTDLLTYLQNNKIDTLVIVGMQTHMCVEAATRAAYDYDFKVILIHDACATKDLKFMDKTIKACDVHNATLSTLKSYAKIVDTKTYLIPK